MIDPTHYVVHLPKEGHDCPLPPFGDYRLKTVIGCQICDRYWFLGRDLDLGENWMDAKWKKLRWFHFLLWRKIRQEQDG